MSDEGRKWLEWEDYLALVAALRAECAGEQQHAVGFVWGGAGYDGAGQGKRAVASY